MRNTCSSPATRQRTRLRASCCALATRVLQTAALTLAWTAADTAPPLVTPPFPAGEARAAAQAQYDAHRAKTILELQRWRTSTEVPLRAAGGGTGSALLIDLNPAVSVWYVLVINDPTRPGAVSYHLENPSGRPLTLLPGDPQRVQLAPGSGTPCTLWSAQGRSALDAGVASGLPYAPLCDANLYLRNAVAGHHTTLERVTDFLRDRVWGGDRIIELVKQQFYQDAFLDREQNPGGLAAAPAPANDAMPIPARVQDAAAGIAAERLMIDVAVPASPFRPGAWYPVRDLDGTYASVLAADRLAEPVRVGREPGVNALDAVESAALTYLVAFDLKRYALHFALGTDHPRVDWSDRPPPAARDPTLPGPDGIGSTAPLVSNGIVAPYDVPRTIAAFTGGFKREHGAFRYGPLALANHGSHYGFVQEGVVFSKLQPGLATVVVTTDGAVDLRTWNIGDDSQLGRIRYARQNGLPLIEFDAATNTSHPGSLVNQWGPGNWSGSAASDLRTVRAALCLQQDATRRYLVYAYFSAATPSAMARVLQGYGCRYAMQGDINALEHTYLALYVHRGNQLVVEHLVDGMQQVDRQSRNTLVPRFLGFPDDRDFFYLTRREASE